ncbi:hypothetical protein [Desulfobulbus sp.]|uniref:hypothetical protein n=1 Tax=Desulfobulbus sp. TaxID=895 RepID=UPI00286FA9FA|nr:hypothetical protein [Desulfobulbus sp.]
MEKEVATSLIAAGAALSGVAVSQLGNIVRTLFDRSNERTALLRTKLEELADNLHKTTEWFDELTKAVSEKDARRVSSNGQNQPVALSSEARRVYVLSLLYFPSMQEEAKTLLNSTYAFYQLMMHPKNITQEELGDSTEKFSTSKKSLDDLIIMEAQKIT